jgi:hypothetical protein
MACPPTTAELVAGPVQVVVVVFVVIVVVSAACASTLLPLWAAATLPIMTATIVVAT